MALGMTQAQADATGWRGTNQGSQLAGRADLWSNGALENDPGLGSSGFNFPPGGFRSFNFGDFDNMTNFGYFWSSSEYNSTHAWYRRLNFDDTQVFRYNYNKRFGFSVRCVRDIN